MVKVFPVKKHRTIERIALLLELNGDTKPKCPLFPSFVWESVNKEMISKVKNLFEFAESVL